MPSSIPLQHVTIHGHEMGYRMAGEGPALLLIHGLAGSSRTWKDVMPRLAENHTVIAPDLMGHGESAKPMGDYSPGAFASGLRDFLGMLDVPQVTVLGQSLGGGVAMQLAYQHPELCERMVLVCSGGLGREVSWILRVLTLPASEYWMPIIFPSFAKHAGERVSGAVSDAGIQAPHLAEMWRAYASITQAPNRHAFIRTMKAVIDPGGQSINATDRLYLATAMPTLIVWGEDDPVIPVEHAYNAHEAIPGSRLEVFEGIGHFPHSEAPNRFLEVLEDFLATSEPSSDNASSYQELLTARVS